MQALQDIFQELGFSSLLPSTREYLIRADKVAAHSKTRREKAEVKVKRNKVKNEKLRSELQKEAQDKKNGLTYESGIALEDGKAAAAATSKSNASAGCKCGSFTHKRTSHKDCPLNSKNKK